MLFSRNSSSWRGKLTTLVLTTATLIACTGKSIEQEELVALEQRVEESTNSEVEFKAEDMCWNMRGFNRPGVEESRWYKHWETQPSPGTLVTPTSLNPLVRMPSSIHFSQPGETLKSIMEVQRPEAAADQERQRMIYSLLNGLHELNVVQREGEQLAKGSPVLLPLARDVEDDYGYVPWHQLCKRPFDALKPTNHTALCEFHVQAPLRIEKTESPFDAAEVSWADVYGVFDYSSDPARPGQLIPTVRSFNLESELYDRPTDGADFPYHVLHRDGSPVQALLLPPNLLSYFHDRLMAEKVDEEGTVRKTIDGMRIQYVRLNGSERSPENAICGVMEWRTYQTVTVDDTPAIVFVPSVPAEIPYLSVPR